MATIIKLNCVNQELSFAENPLIASGGYNEDKLQINFCDLWNGYAKICVFYQNPNKHYFAMMEDDDTCVIPYEVLQSDGILYLGVFGSNTEGKTRTSQIVKYVVEKGAININIQPEDPTPDIYEQLLSKYELMLETSRKTYADEQTFERNITTQQNSFEESITNQQNAFETDLQGQFNEYKVQVPTIAKDTAQTTVVRYNTSIEATLLSANWTSEGSQYVQTLNIADIKNTDTPIIDVNLGSDYQTEIGEWAKITKATTGTGTIKFYANSQPSVDLNIYIKGVNNGEVVDYSDLKGYFIECRNKLDLSSCTPNTYIDLSTGEEKAHSQLKTSDYIKIEKGETYTSKHWYGYYGANLKFPIYDENKNFLKTITPTNVDTANNIATFTSDVDGYTRVVLSNDNLTAMFVIGEEYPTEYILYSDKVHLSDNVFINSDNVEGISEKVDGAIGSLNIGEKVTVLIEKDLEVIDKYFTFNGTYQSGAYHVEIPSIKSGELYYIKAKTGSAVRTYVITDKNGNITRFANAETWATYHDYDVAVTISDVENGGTLFINTIDNTYIGLKLEEEQFLFNGEHIKDNTIPFEKLKTTYNILHGKTAIFDGDSICHGTSVGSEEPTYGYGWAGRIGIGNNMTYKNFGISGGVITSASAFDVSGIHSVVDNIDTMYAQYPNADYIIFEGGTNDADRIGDARTTPPDKFGTFSMTDFSGNYDIETFTGALETIFYKATNYWKGKHIGYIVAQKMGYGSSAQYDSAHSNRRLYFERAIEICKKWGIPYLDLWNECYLVPTNPNMYDSSKTSAENIETGNLYTDGQHLTAYGYDYISPIIEEWMRRI